MALFMCSLTESPALPADERLSEAVRPVTASEKRQTASQGLALPLIDSSRQVRSSAMITWWLNPGCLRSRRRR